MSNRFEGKSLEEALQNAADTFHVERYQLTYHVVLEKRGFLGGVKRVVIEAEINTAATQPEAAPPPPVATVDGNIDGNVESRVRATTPAQGAPRRGPRREYESGGGRERGGRRGGGRRGGQGGRGERQAGGGQPGGGRGRGGRTGEGLAWVHDPVDPVEPVQVPDQMAESEPATAVHAWVDQVVKLAKIDVVARTEENDERLTIKFFGRDTRRLTAQHGELLDAIQVLANKALGGRTIEKDIEFNCEAFKEKRTEDLEQRAREIADRVRRGGREELLPAMTPIERRIIHLALQNDEEVTTESRGDGFYKRVAIIPRTSAASS